MQRSIEISKTLTLLSLGIAVFSMAAFYHFFSIAIGCSLFFALLYFILHRIQNKETWGKAYFRHLLHVYLPMFLVFGLFFISVFYSENRSYAWFNLSIKLGLLIFPLIFILMGKGFIGKREFFFLTHAFILGCIIFQIQKLLGIYQVIQKYEATQKLWAEGDLSGILRHPIFRSISYFIAPFFRYGPHYEVPYYLTSIGFLLYHFLRPHGIPVCQTTWYKILNIGLTSVFLLSISLISKSGLLWVIILCGSLWIYLWVRKKYIWAGSLTLLLLLSGWGLYRTQPNSIDNLTKTILILTDDKPDSYDTSVIPRIYLWKSACSAMKEVPLTGFGIGDAKTELKRFYHPNLPVERIPEYDVHNNFLEFALFAGWGATLLLVWIFVAGFHACYRNKDLLFFFLYTLLFFFCLIENFLELQLGISLFCFVFSLGQATACRPGAENPNGQEVPAKY